MRSWNLVLIGALTTTIFASSPSQALIICEGCDAPYQEEPECCKDRLAKFNTVSEVMMSCRIQQVANSCSFATQGPGNDWDDWVEMLLSGNQPHDFFTVAWHSSSHEEFALRDLLEKQGEVCHACMVPETAIVATAYLLAECQLRLMACGATYDPNYRWQEPVRQSCPPPKKKTLVRSKTSLGLSS